MSRPFEAPLMSVAVNGGSLLIMYSYSISLQSTLLIRFVVASIAEAAFSMPPVIVLAIPSTPVKNDGFSG